MGVNLSLRFHATSRQPEGVDRPVEIILPFGFADRQALAQGRFVYLDHLHTGAFQIHHLVADGADTGWCERVAAVMAGPALEPGLEWAAGAVSVAALLAELKESSRRISALVAAVKSYTQMDRASMQCIDVTEGLDSTVVMLGHTLSDRVTVVRDYDAALPQIDAHAAELNQVWTNLIGNAIEAMDGKGELRLSAHAGPDHIVVEIADTGGGMPPDVAARAFEPFFTTKDASKSTGLGLDIARRIVIERHGGTIEIESEPGCTVLRVRIPVRAA